MNRVFGFFILFAGGILLAAAEPLPKPLVTGLNCPRAAVLGADRRVYLTVAVEPSKEGTAGIAVIHNGKAASFATGLFDPQGVLVWQGQFFVADRDRVWQINPSGKATVFVTAPPGKSFRHLAVDEAGTLYVGAADSAGSGAWTLYRAGPNKIIEMVTHAGLVAQVKKLSGIALDGMTHILLLDGSAGTLYRLQIATGAATQLADGLGDCAGLAWDKFGRLFITDAKGGRVFAINRPGAKPVLLAEGLQTPGGPCVDAIGHSLLVPDTKAGTLTAVPISIPGAEVDTTPLPLEPAVAFPDLKWTGWKSEVSGKVVPLRPIVLTHAGDGSNRVFVATQHGVIHAFPDDQKATNTDVFLDIQDRVRYDDNSNEEGFLGLTFHPSFKKNGEFFIFYTPKKEKLVNYLSRFRIGADGKGDPGSEELLLMIERPFWNHDGGTICFGPDGYLYVALGDGGSANDPFGHGQNLKSILGKILRIDVNSKDGDKKYALPKDNPFLGRPDARPEIWAYGLRNVWRMAFDRQTGQLWAADVGQNLYEEINLIQRGGNYGWNLREALHPFGAKGSGTRPDLIDPIWEYHHDIGKSITGGFVYRGTRLPELAGSYVYADYVSGRMWALRYDADKKRVVANRPIPDRSLPVMSFGEDEKGELYFMLASATGKGIYRLVRPTIGSR